MRILVVEDEKRLANALKQILEEQRYQVDAAYTGNEGYDFAQSGLYDLIVLDVMLPGMDGFEVARKLRKNKIQTPILMLTAKSTVPDKVSGLDSGADDYMTKPFAPQELLARIRALSRRQGDVVADELSFGDICFVPAAGTLSCGQKEIRLNYKESQILKLLLARPSFILSKEELITKVWGYDSDAGDSNVEAYISFLRKKLSFISSNTLIVSVKKQGYHLEAPHA